MDAKKKILIVDDDADFIEALAFFLEKNGLEVIKARDGRQGLKLAKMERPDLILVDIMMTERTEGLFTVQEMRRTKELAATPVFVTSALYARMPEFRVAPDSGWLASDEFFAKPVDMALLLSKIRQRLGMGAANN
jgi:two-component system alkaline phosphatase synthesis response regulator PhoP